MTEDIRYVTIDGVRHDLSTEDGRKAVADYTKSLEETIRSNAKKAVKKVIRFTDETSPTAPIEERTRVYRHRLSLIDAGNYDSVEFIDASGSTVTEPAADYVAAITRFLSIAKVPYSTLNADTPEGIEELSDMISRGDTSGYAYVLLEGVRYENTPEFQESLLALVNNKPKSTSDAADSGESKDKKVFTLNLPSDKLPLSDILLKIRSLYKELYSIHNGTDANGYTHVQVGDNLYGIDSSGIYKVIMLLVNFINTAEDAIQNAKNSADADNPSDAEGEEQVYELRLYTGTSAEEKLEIAKAAYAAITADGNPYTILRQINVSGDSEDIEIPKAIERLAKYIKANTPETSAADKAGSGVTVLEIPDRPSEAITSIQDFLTAHKENPAKLIDYGDGPVAADDAVKALTEYLDYLQDVYDSNITADITDEDLVKEYKNIIRALDSKHPPKYIYYPDREDTEPEPIKSKDFYTEEVDRLTGKSGTRSKASTPGKTLKLGIIIPDDADPVAYLQERKKLLIRRGSSFSSVILQGDGFDETPLSPSDAIKVLDTKIAEYEALGGL